MTKRYSPNLLPSLPPPLSPSLPPPLSPSLPPLPPALCLIEWPERLGTYTPSTRLEINLSALDEETRTVVVRGVGGGWAGEVVGRLEEVMKEE